MKKIYFLASLLISSGLCVAQVTKTQTLGAERTMSATVPQHSSGSTDRAAGDPIGPVMDFSIPAAWVMANTGTPSANWVIGTAGPVGSYSASMGTITSTSGGNFAMFDSDGVGSGTSVQDATITTAAPVDLSAYSNVGIEFESYYRHFQGQCFLEVSNDGATWTAFQVHTLLPVNESSANPELVALNISGVAANQASVWFRFRYIGGWDYAWMIDDVQLLEGYDDNLTIGQTYLSMGVEMMDYYMIPTSQIMDATFGAWVTNAGVNNQASTVLNVVANNGTTDVYDETSAGVTINAFTMDSLELTSPVWTPTAGTFSLTYSTSSSATDQDPADNMVVLEDIFVGGDVYARDNGAVSGSVGYLGDPPATPTSMGNFFEFASDFTFGQIQVGISSSSSEDLVFAEVRTWDGADWIQVASTPDYTITAGDLGSIITLTLPTEFDAVAGDVIYVGAGHYGSDVRIMTAQIGPGAAIFNDDGAYTQSSVFFIRLKETYAGVEENASVNNLSVYPNPATDMVTFAYRLDVSSNVNVTVTDVTGKVIITDNFGVQPDGNYTKQLNTSELANGVYFYNLDVDGVVTTTKFTIARN